MLRTLDRGLRVVLVTGRRLPSARRVADELTPDLPLVCHNGALIHADGGLLRSRPLERAVALAAVEVGRRLGGHAVLHCGEGGEGRLVVEANARNDTLLAYYLDRSHPDVFVVESLGAVLALEDPMQVMFGGPIERMAEIATALDGMDVRLERTVYPAQGVAVVDVLAPGVGKAGAVSLLRERWGIAAGETLAIGDNWNDLEMLQEAGIGLLMANAAPELAACGLPVVPSCDEDGVAVALERHVLIG